MNQLFFLIALAFTINVQAQNKFTAKWDNGFKLQSEDKNFILKFGGRAFYDFAFTFQDSLRSATFGELKNGNEFRAVRLYHSGTIYKNLKYKFNIDFAGGKVTFKDVYIQYAKIPVIGNLRVGHFYTPIGLEANTSSKYLTFLESAMLNSFTPSRNTGLMIYNSFLTGKLNVQLGAFRYTDKFGNDKNANDGIKFNGKVSSAVFQNKEKNILLHLGLGYEYSHANDSIYKMGYTSESHLGNKFKGKINSIEHTDLVNIEAALVLKSFSLQSEFSLMSAHKYTSETYLQDGFYVFASYL